MIELYVFNGNIEVRKPETITSGRVGHKIYIQFDKKWNSLTKKRATFKAGNVSRITTLPEGNEIITKIPVEVLINSGCDLEIGIKGWDTELNTILPTKYVKLGYIHPGSEIVKNESLLMIQNAGDLDRLRIATDEEIEELLNEIFQTQEDENEESEENEESQP